MRRLALGLLGTLMGLALGCSGISVHTDWDRDVDFSKLQTWSFAPNAQIETGNPRLDDDTLFTNRVRAAVTMTLPSLGYPEVDRQAGKPDFLVAFFPVVQDKTSVSTINDYYGYDYGGAHYGYHGGWGYGPGGFGSQTIVDQYQEGTLVIDITRATDGDLIWRGSGSVRLKEKSTPEQSTKLVNQAVSKILAGFPPGGHKSKE